MVPLPAEIARRDARRMAVVLQELGGDGQTCGTGWLSCDIEGSWADFGAGLGLDGPVDDAELDALFGFYAARARPARVQLTPYEHPSLRKGLSARGFVLYEQETLLVRSTSSPAKSADIDGLHYRRVDPTVDADVEAFVDAQLQGFYAPEAAPPGLAPITRRVARNARSRLWLLELDGHVVGSGGLEVFENSAVLIAGAVLPEARRRGIQGAFIQHRIEAARDSGVDYVLVGSTPGGPTERNALRAGFGVATALFGLERPHTPR